MDLNLLPLLLAVAEERNFRAAIDPIGVYGRATFQPFSRLLPVFSAA